MSDLAEAVFGGQLLGHVIAGEAMTTSVIAQAAINADMASSLVVDPKLSPTAESILQAKVAHHTFVDGHYEPGQVIDDYFDAQSFSDLHELAGT